MRKELGRAECRGRFASGGCQQNSIYNVPNCKTTERVLPETANIWTRQTGGQ